MMLSNLTYSHAVCSTLLSLKIKVIPDSKNPGAFYPTQSRAASCAAPVPYPSGEEVEVRAMPLLVEAFVDATKTIAGEDGKTEKTRKGDLHFLASVFANLSAVSATLLVYLVQLLTDLCTVQTPTGRQYFVTPDDFSPFVESGEKTQEYPLSKLIAFTEHPVAKRHARI